MPLCAATEKGSAFFFRGRREKKLPTPWLGVFLAATLLLGGPSQSSLLQAAESELLGVIALTAEKEVADELELTPSQKDRLRQLVISREDEGLSLALDVKNLPPDERHQRLAPFRAESERLGMQILTFRQRSLIQRIRLQKAGVSALVEPGMVEALALTDEQRQELEKLAAERAQALRSSPGDELPRVEADYHEAMLLVLGNEQKESFTQMLGGARPLPEVAPDAGADDVEAPSAVAGAADGDNVPRPDAALDPDSSTGVAQAEQDANESASEQSVLPESVNVAEDDTIPPAPRANDAAADPTVAESDTAEPTRTREGFEDAAKATTQSDAAVSDPPVIDATDDRPTETGDPSAPREQPVTRPAANVPDPMPAGDGLLRFSFHYAPWKDVIEWFAAHNDLALQMDASPDGTFNYSDPRSYTPGEALDLINRILLGKGFTLIRHDQMLFVIRIEDGIPPNLVPSVMPSELDDLGESELVSVVFPLGVLTTEEAMAEIQPLMRPQGAIVQLPRSRRIQVTETAGRLRLIRSVLEAIESPAAAFGKLEQIALVYRLADEVLPLVREMLGIPSDTNALPDNSLRVTVGLDGQQLLARGSADRIARLKEIVELVDKPGPAGSGVGAIQMPQLEVYPIAGADPAAVLRVLQTILAGDPDARLEVDAQTGNLYALARPGQHATIRATIAQAERDARQIDVIPLTTVDPQVAVLAIGKLFGAGGEAADPSAPKVDADPTTRSLMVRGTESQLAQIRSLLEKLGENMSARVTGANRGNVRLLPLGGREATSALYQIEQIWPALRPNRIRILSPSSGVGIPTFRPSEPTRPAAETVPWQALPLDELRSLQKESAETPDTEGASQPDGKQASAYPVGRASPPDPIQREFLHTKLSVQHQAPIVAVGQPRTANLRTAPVRFAAQQAPAGGPPPIIIAPGPGGVLIASEDAAALDELEALLASVASRTAASGRELAVFYLRYARATTVTETLTELFGGGSSSGGEGGLLGDLAGAALGEAGGLVTGLLGMGGGGSASLMGGSVDIVPDNRLNALVVEAKPADLDTVEQLLRVLDQPASPEEIQVDAPPRLIPVYNTSASQVAAVVQQVYQDRLRGGGGGQQQQPSPEDIIRLLRGGRNGQGGNDREQQEAEKMSVGIDARSNSLVVRAPDPLFAEVKLLVESLDTAEVAFPQETRVVNLQGANSATVQRALSAIYGGSVQTTNQPGADQSQPGDAPSLPGQPQSNRGPRRGAGRGPQQEGNPAEFFEGIRRFQEFQQRMQGGGQERGGRGGRGGGR